MAGTSVRIRPSRLGDGKELPKPLGSIQRGHGCARRTYDAGASPQEYRPADADQSLDFRLPGHLEVTGNQHESVEMSRGPKSRVPGNQQNTLAPPSIHDQ